MKSRLSNFAVFVSMLLGFLGISVLVGKKRRKKENKKELEQIKDIKLDTDVQGSENKTETEKVSPTIEDNERKLASKQRIIYNDVDDLLVDVLKRVLKEADFSNPSDFMESFIKKSTVLCDNNDWYNYFPKNKEELEDFVGKENLEWTLSTVKPPIPDIIKIPNKKIEIGCFIVKNDEDYEVMDADDFQKKYEEI